jgi:hypothetical protein
MSGIPGDADMALAQLEGLADQRELAAHGLELPVDLRRGGGAGHGELAAPLGVESSPAHVHPSGEVDLQVQRDAGGIGLRHLDGLAAGDDPPAAHLHHVDLHDPGRQIVDEADLDPIRGDRAGQPAAAVGSRYVGKVRVQRARHVVASHHHQVVGHDAHLRRRADRAQPDIAAARERAAATVGGREMA